MKNKIKTIFTYSLVAWLWAAVSAGEKIVINHEIQLYPVGDSIYVHVSWQQSGKYGRFPSNGLILIKGGKALMADTPMDDEKTRIPTHYIEDSLSAHLTTLIIGHIHDDCLGGLQSRGIKSIATRLTSEKCRQLELPVPAVAFSDSLTIDFHGERVECRYFGRGHTKDNLTVCLPAQKILFGGCLVISANSKNLGHLKDAVVPQWAETLRRILAAYPDMKLEIPGHGARGDRQLITHTIQLNEKIRQVT